MSRKNIILFIITGIIAVALIAGGFAYKYYASFHKVTISVQRSDLTVDIYQAKAGVDEHDASSGIKQGTVKGTGTLSLQQGDYYILPTGTKYDTSDISFTVKDKDLTVKVNPGYSEEYLASQLTKELPAINAVITAKYPSATSNFKLNSGKLYGDGTWYGTTLVQYAEAGENGDVYRTVLHKVNGTWQFAATPELVISSLLHKDIPISILSDLNGQSGY
jgi:hypothetical protein